MKELFHNWFTYLSSLITIILFLIPILGWEMKVILILLSFLISFVGIYFRVFNKLKLANEVVEKAKTTSADLKKTSKQKLEDLETENNKLAAKNEEFKNLIRDYKLLTNKSKSFLDTECEHIKEIYSHTLMDAQFEFRESKFKPVIQVFSGFKIVLSQKINEERRDFDDRISSIQSREDIR